MTFTKPPSSMRQPERCGICAAPKITKTYAVQQKMGVANQEVHLCERCDLAPDPPVRISRGEN